MVRGKATSKNDELNVPLKKSYFSGIIWLLGENFEKKKKTEKLDARIVARLYFVKILFDSARVIDRIYPACISMVYFFHATARLSLLILFLPGHRTYFVSILYSFHLLATSSTVFSHHFSSIYSISRFLFHSVHRVTRGASTLLIYVWNILEFLLSAPLRIFESKTCPVLNI